MTSPSLTPCSAYQTATRPCGCTLARSTGVSSIISGKRQAGLATDQGHMCCPLLERPPSHYLQTQLHIQPKRVPKNIRSSSDSTLRNERTELDMKISKRLGGPSGTRFTMAPSRFWSCHQKQKFRTSSTKIMSRSRHCWTKNSDSFQITRVTSPFALQKGRIHQHPVSFRPSSATCNMLGSALRLTRSRAMQIGMTSPSTWLTGKVSG